MSLRFASTGRTVRAMAHLDNLAGVGLLLSFRRSKARKQPMRWYRLLGGALLTALIGVSAAASAQQAATGAEEFHNSCAVCHGEDGRGDGPLAKVLTVKPADLTQLAKRNDGVFPIEKVSETIDGRQQVGAHGTREMPVWGARYEAEVGRQYGPYGSESLVKTRIYVLVRYLQSIQKN
jgi:mono/diheme cytochrome c family protein